MSFPKIPDINPNISITLEDAINLLLSSIAFEEISLSKLIDAETCKILHILDDCKHKASVLEDALAINKSVDDTIKNIIKLQMLLQFKLENVTELISTTTTTTTTTTTASTTTTSTTNTTTTTKTTTTQSTSTSTTTHTTTCTTYTCSTSTCLIIAKKECCCCLIGKGKGCITNKSDEFFSQEAVLNVFVNSCDYNNRSVHYSVQNDVDSLHMEATARRITVDCPSPKYLYRTVIYGKGRAEKKSKCHKDIVGNVNFTLTVWIKPMGKLEYRMEITSKEKEQLNHDSGLVKIKEYCSTLRFEICCC